MNGTSNGEGAVGRAAAAGRRAVSLLLIGAVRAYQLVLSPWLGNRCRHEPTCSAYAIEAIRRFGPLAGGWRSLKRLSRCHPWGTWGYDPVSDDPEKDRPTARDADGVRRGA